MSTKLKPPWADQRVQAYYHFLKQQIISSQGLVRFLPTACSKLLAFYLNIFPNTSCCSMSVVSKRMKINHTVDCVISCALRLQLRTGGMEITTWHIKGLNIFLSLKVSSWCYVYADVLKVYRCNMKQSGFSVSSLTSLLCRNKTGCSWTTQSLQGCFFSVLVRVQPLSRTYDLLTHLGCAIRQEKKNLSPDQQRTASSREFTSTFFSYFYLAGWVNETLILPITPD